MPECTVEQPTQYARSLRPSTPSARTTAATSRLRLYPPKSLAPILPHGPSPGRIPCVVAGADRIGCLLSARTRTATSESVKPLGEGDKAISASTTHTQSQIQHSQTWLSRPIAGGSDKASAILARPAASAIVVKQSPSLVASSPYRQRVAGREGGISASWAGVITRSEANTEGRFPDAAQTTNGRVTLSGLLLHSASLLCFDDPRKQGRLAGKR
jgi:hypothetical protein